MKIKEQIAWLRDISHHSMAVDCQREADTMERLLAVYEAALAHSEGVTFPCDKIEGELTNALDAAIAAVKDS